MSAPQKIFNGQLPVVDRQEQQRLGLDWGVPGQPPDIGMVVNQPNMLAAINLAVQLSGLEDQKIARKLGLDKAHWSKIKAGSHHLAPNLLIPLMEACGNHAPLWWLVYHCGFDPSTLHRRRSETEKRLEQTQLELEEKRREIEILRRLFTERN